MTTMAEGASSVYDYPLLLKHLLHTPLSHAPNQEIVYRDNFRYTYLDMVERLGRLANALAGLGVKPGVTVAVLDWDSHRYLECFFAVPMMGAVLHTVNVRLSPDQLVYTINHAEDDVILVHVDFLPLLEQIRDRLETVKSFVLLGDGRDSPRTSVPLAGEYEDLLAGSSADYEFPEFDENSRATIFYTTGTTGLPKGVSFSHRQLVLHTVTGLAALSSPSSQGRFHQDDIYMPITPMFHVHAWGMPYIATMLGVKQVYPGRYEPTMILSLLEKERVTFSHCVPTILHMLLNHPSAMEVDLSNWKVVIGGSALPKSLCKAAIAREIDIWTGYGMSETCPILALSHLSPEMYEWDQDRQVEVRCKTGRPIPLVDLRIVDDAIKDVPRNGEAVGEIAVRSPWLVRGYLKDTKSTEALWSGGYLHTGDVASIDGRGYVQISDRIKDVIKSGGEWISSLAIEDILSMHPAVGEVAVIGVPDARWGERPLALVVPNPAFTSKEIEVELKDHVRSYADKGIISKWGVPEGIRMVCAIDKTSVGKIDKKTLRKKYSFSRTPSQGEERATT